MSDPQAQTPVQILEAARAALVAELAEWKRAENPEVFVPGKPFIVLCTSGFALKLDGIKAIPVKLRPDLAAPTHMTFEQAASVARRFGAGYRAVPALDVAAIHRRELTEAINALALAC